MANHIFIGILLLFLPTAYANGGEAPAKKVETHGKSGGEHGKPEEPAPPPVPQGPRRYYFPGKVVPFPSFSALFLDQLGTLDFKPQKGYAAMIIFVASWCEPCQALMPDFKHLARKYDSASTKVYFVYAHDTGPDAEGSAKEHQVQASSVMANLELLMSFRNPEIPSVFISDKWGYLADQYPNTKKTDIDRIDISMGKITAL